MAAQPVKQTKAQHKVTVLGINNKYLVRAQDATVRVAKLVNSTLPSLLMRKAMTERAKGLTIQVQPQLRALFSLPQGKLYSWKAQTVWVCSILKPQAMQL